MGQGVEVSDGESFDLGGVQPLQSEGLGPSRVGQGDADGKGDKGQFRSGHGFSLERSSALNRRA